MLRWKLHCVLIWDNKRAAVGNDPEDGSEESDEWIFLCVDSPTPQRNNNNEMRSLELYYYLIDAAAGGLSIFYSRAVVELASDITL